VVRRRLARNDKVRLHSRTTVLALLAVLAPAGVAHTRSIDVLAAMGTTLAQTRTDTPLAILLPSRMDSATYKPVWPRRISTLDNPDMKNSLQRGMFFLGSITPPGTPRGGTKMVRKGFRAWIDARTDDAAAKRVSRRLGLARW